VPSELSRELTEIYRREEHIDVSIDKCAGDEIIRQERGFIV
jgi:hypothetical protein